MQEMLRLHRHALEAGDLELARLLEGRLASRSRRSRRPAPAGLSGPALCVERLARLLGLRR